LFLPAGREAASRLDIESGGKRRRKAVAQHRHFLFGGIESHGGDAAAGYLDKLRFMLINAGAISPA
jgi:hypothetical protein